MRLYYGDGKINRYQTCWQPDKAGGYPWHQSVSHCPMGRGCACYANLSTESTVSQMVQKRNTIREQILEALAEGHMSSKELTKKINCHPESIKDIRGKLVKENLIKEVGHVLGNKGVGCEKIWGLVKAKPKAVNAFDWQNWASPSMYSARELAYSNVSYANRKEPRVIVYSGA